MRDKLILEFWDRSNILSLNNKEYYSYVKKLIDGKIKEDIGKGDITTDSLIDENKEINACVIAREEGIVAGIEEISMLGEIKPVKKDGDEVKNGEIILELFGNARKILAYERTLLNILQRMSGIATLTYNTKELVKNNCHIAGTRKTLINLLDKKALLVGGASTHRLNLSDAVLIKDSHLEILNNGFEKALRLVENTKTKYIEVEVKNEEEALKAAKAIFNLKSEKLFAIMFDNMKSSEIKNSIDKIKSSYKIDNLLFEASGGINEGDIEEYSKTGVDVVSLGFLTHSPKAFNLSLEVK